MKNTSLEFLAPGTFKVDRLYLMTLLEHFKDSLCPEAAALLASNEQLRCQEWCAKWADQREEAPQAQHWRAPGWPTARHRVVARGWTGLPRVQ